ncbi:FHA domain-containing protein [Stutzerimonas stutzeri]
MLRIHFADNRQAPVWLADEHFTFGADATNDLVLKDADVGAFHAELRQENRFYYLTDLGTAGGTFVNEERIGERYQIRSGDRVRLGSVELQILDPAKVGARTGQAPRWLLQVLQGENQGHKYHITGSMTFGRSVKCELCFSDPELSRRHAEFFLKGDVLEVKDLASANGLKVNRERVTTAVLQPGDQVQLGSTTLLVIGPKVSVTEAIDEDATVFMAASELPPITAPSPAPKPSQPRPASPNPLKPAIANAPVQVVPASSRRNAILVAVLIVAAGVALAQQFL